MNKHSSPPADMSRPTIETKQPAMPETPRTDAETSKGRIWLDGWYGELGEYVPAEIARQLERELASTQRMLADCYEAQRIGTQYAAPQASNGSPQGSGVGQRQTAPLLGEVAESDNAPAAVAAPLALSTGGGKPSDDLERLVESGRQFRLRMAKSPYEAMNIALSANDLARIGFALRQLTGTQSSTGEPSEVPCARCGGRVVEFVVPSDVWNSVVRLDGKEGDDEYLCEACYRNAVTAWVRSSRSSKEAPKQIIDPPGAAVEMFRRQEGRLPNRPGDHLSLTDRLELAAQACHAAHLLSCETTCREAAKALSSAKGGTS